MPFWEELTAPSTRKGGFLVNYLADNHVSTLVGYPASITKVDIFNPLQKFSSLVLQT